MIWSFMFSLFYMNKHYILVAKFVGCLQIARGCATTGTILTSVWHWAMIKYVFEMLSKKTCWVDDKISFNNLSIEKDKVFLRRFFSITYKAVIWNGEFLRSWLCIQINIFLVFIHLTMSLVILSHQSWELGRGRTY